MLANPTLSPSSPPLEIARGNVPHLINVFKFGRNPDITTVEDVWTVGGVYPFPTVALPVRIKVGGNPADDVGGLNARAVTVVGLDPTFALQTSVLVTAGAAASAQTAESYIRVFRAFVTDAGLYNNTNLGNIDIETNAGTTLARIGAGLGQTQMAIYTVPLGHRAYLRRLNVHPESTKAVDLTVFQRQDADIIVAPTTAPRIIVGYTQVTEHFDHVFDSTPELPEKTDIWLRASNPSAATAVSVEFGLWEELVV
jgi:hypothetical protein